MKKQLHILEGIIILTIIFIAILLSIKFIYHIKEEKMDTSYMWDIKISNIITTPGSKEGNLNIENNTLNLEVLFENETEFYEFSFDIENNGTLDAKLDNYNIIIDNPKNILNYSIKYSDNTEIKKNDLLNSKSKKTIIVRIDYPKQNEKIYEALKLTMDLKMNYTAIYKNE